MCAGKAQSPIELSDVPLVGVSYPPLRWEGHWDVRDSGFILANIYQGGKCLKLLRRWFCNL